MRLDIVEGTLIVPEEILQAPVEVVEVEAVVVEASEEQEHVFHSFGCQECGFLGCRCNP